MPIEVISKGEHTLICEYRMPEGPFQPPVTHRLRLTALEGGAVRVTRTARETFLDTPSAIVTGAKPGRYSLTETADRICMDCGDTVVEIGRAKGALAFYNRDHQLLLREPEKQPYLLVEKQVLRNRFQSDAEVTLTQSVDGIRASAEAYETYVDRTAYEWKQSFVFDKDEALYGLGSHEEGYGNLRGRMRALYQQNMKAVVPVLVSTKGWGLLFDASCLMVFHDDAEGSYLWADCADELDYYYLSGGGYPAVMASYARLTGQTPMLPKYAFGYIQSKERYQDADELVAVVKEYRRRGVPLDMIVLDWCSWPEGLWGYKVFDRSRFPDPKALTDALHALGAKMMISIWPSMRGDENVNRTEMLRIGGMLGNRAVYDAFNPEARKLYWKQANEGLFQYGVDAWWCDCSEPFEADWHGQIKPEPHERVRINTDEAKKYLDPTQINAYSLMHSEGLYTGQRAVTDRKRVVNLTRSSYAGQHRYATITWSGDVSSTWEVLRRHVPEGVNFCATGEPYWTTDVGGFFPMGGGAWFGSGDYNTGVADLGYRELYVRWLQYAAFLPMMRSHGTGTPREIWRFGEKGTPFYDAIEKTIRLRYALLPYLYSLAAQCADTGMPLLRAPALEFPRDTALRQIDDQMMLGSALLVKPVTHPMLYGPESTPVAPTDDTETVTLPEGSCWYALDTEERYPGGQTITVDAPLDRIPVFVRAGSVIPTQPVLQYTGEVAHPPLTITVYPGADGAFTLYDDEGDSYDYEKGECARIALQWNDARGELSIGAREGTYPGMPGHIDLTLRVAGSEEVTLAYDGSPRSIQLISNAKERY
ncbi:MAG TPA: glycoside hydrolase family 31 protein [Candidatus Limiplasma sp.]|nr:glycoside hydrolase family 31 protein [Candidatus Limiplasma sp.]